MSDEITITAGRPNRQGDEKDFAGPDGTYRATLVAVTEPVTAKSTMADAKGDGTWTYRDWTFAIDGGTPFDGQVLDVRANAGSSGPKSKQFAIIAALVGKTPPVGARIDIQQHLVGRQCLLGIKTNENDFPYADTFMAVPGQPAAPAAAQAAPAAPAVPTDTSSVVPGAARAQVEQAAAQDKALPF